MSRGLSNLQRTILAVLENRPDKCWRTEALSYQVAKEYSPPAFWRLSDIKQDTPQGELLYALGKSVHKKRELIRNVFSASFSRALKGLEKRGLVQLQRDGYDLTYEIEGQVTIWAVKKGTRPRVKFVVHRESKYFGLEVPQAHDLIDIGNRIRSNVPKT